MGRISGNMERNLSKYQQLLADLDHPMDGLDAISSGLLSYTIILPGKISRIIRPCKNGIDYHIHPYRKEHSPEGNMVLHLLSTNTAVFFL